MDFDSILDAKNFFASIKPELRDDFGRSTTRIVQKKERLVVEISAADKTSLRASFNSITKPFVLFTQVGELE